MLYATRGNLVDKKAELIVIRLTDNATSAPILLASLDYPETDNYNGGELQISADGKQLLWYHLGQRAAFFDYQHVKPYSFALSENMATVLGNGTFIGTTSNIFTLQSKASIDIDQSAVIYFTQKDLAGNNTLWKSVDLGVATNANINNSTEVRRGKDGMIHQAQVYVGSGLPVQVHTITDVPLSAPIRTYASRLLRVRNYELKDHLGNVRVIVSDQKQADASAKVQSYANYYAFGMEMPGLQYVDNQGVEYRYGFNGKENDKDFGTAGLTQDYGFRLYNPAIAKFLSVNPLSPSYPMLTPYQFASNRPIDGIDLDGLEFLASNNPNLKSDAITANPNSGYLIKISETQSISATDKFTIFVDKKPVDYYNVGTHLYYVDLKWFFGGERNQQQTVGTKTGVQLTSNIENLEDAPRGYVAPDTWKYPAQSLNVANKYKNCRGMCFVISMARVEKAFLNAMNISVLKFSFNEQDYNISGTGTINRTTIPDKYFGYGVGGALAAKNYADLVDNTGVWKGELQEGAMLQYWEGNDATAIVKESTTLSGHSIIFKSYNYDSKGKINGLNYYDYSGTNGKFDKEDCGKVFFGANLKDSN